MIPVEIPNYPSFINIELKHKRKIEDLCRNFPPYCDFIFSSLYMWEVDNFKSQLSILNGNLVVKTKNIITHSVEISFIGINKIDETINTLLDSYELITLVPEQIVGYIRNPNIKYSEDKENHDYIFSTQAISELKGKLFLGKRRRVNKFARENPNHEVIVLDKSNKSKLRDIIIDVCYKWACSKEKKLIYKIEPEFLAIENFLKICHMIDVEIWGLKINGDMKAFGTIEYLNNDYALSSFAKADLNYPDANTFLTYKTTEYLFREKNIKYINHEQDLGLLNLRYEKLSWKPVSFLKKYIITKRND